MKRLRFVVIKNSAANVVRGGASSIVALTLPYFLAKKLNTDRYAAWVLMLQIAAYANYLDFGVQTAVARFSAQAIEGGDKDELNRIASSAFRLLALAGLLTMVLSLAVIGLLPWLFPKAPIILRSELRAGVFLLSASATMLLPLSTFSGVLIGLHRNEYPALAIGITRLLGAGSVVLILPFTHSLVWLALCIGGFNLIGGLVQLAICRRLLPNLHLHLVGAAARIKPEILHYCGSLTVLNLAMLLVGGLDVTIVGFFVFSAAGYYALAATAVGFLTGISSSVFTALLAPMAVLQKRQETARIRQLVLNSSRLGEYAFLLLITMTLLQGKSLLTLWVGEEYALQAFPILIVLICAQAVRLMGTGFSIALLATGQQLQGVVGAMVEGIVNLLVSIVAVFYLGPIGGAWGTVIGSICGVSWLAFYTMRKVKEIQIPSGEFLTEVGLRPLICFLPLLLVAVLHLNRGISMLYVLLGLVATLALLGNFGEIPWRSVVTAISKKSPEHFNNRYGVE